MRSQLTLLAHSASLPLPLIPLGQHPTFGVLIKGHAVQRSQSARPEKHTLVHPAIVPAETTIELPVQEAPRIYKPDSVRPDLCEEPHDRLGARELDLADGSDGAGEEPRGLAIEGVQGAEAEELVQEGDGVSVEGGGGLGVVEGGVGVLDDEVMRAGGAEAPEVDEERVPGLAVLVPVPEGFEGEEGVRPTKATTRFVSEFSMSKAAPMSCRARKWRRIRKVSLSAAEP